MGMQGLRSERVTQEINDENKIFGMRKRDKENRGSEEQNSVSTFTYSERIQDDCNKSN